MRKKFTLVELLVVIAVIAILAGLLLPALKKAKDTAKKTICTGNLKQIAVAFSAYLFDYNEYYPKSILCEYGYYWSNMFYCDTTGKPLEGSGTCVCGKHGKMNNYLGYCGNGNKYESGIFHCPSQTISPCVNTPKCPVSYGMANFPGGKAYSTASWTTPHSKISSIEVPSLGMLVMEGGTLNIEGWIWWNVTIPRNHFGLNNGIHSLGTNVLYFDGHVDHKRVYDIPPDSNTLTSSKNFWFGIK